jgi:hypothetical protein
MAAQLRNSNRRMKVFIETHEGRRRAWASSRVPMPKNFCFESNYDESIQRLADLRKSLNQTARNFLRHKGARRNKVPRLPSYLDFSTIQTCAPAAALILAAEFDRARTLLPMGIRLVNLEAWRQDLVESLDQIGFFELLSIPRPRKATKIRDVSIVRFQTGSTFGNEQAGSLMKTLAGMIVGADEVSALDDPAIMTARLRLYSALVEACENARRHAYPPDRCRLPRRKTVNPRGVRSRGDDSGKFTRLGGVYLDQTRPKVII